MIVHRLDTTPLGGGSCPLIVAVSETGTENTRTCLQFCSKAAHACRREESRETNLFFFSFFFFLHSSSSWWTPESLCYQVSDASLATLCVGAKFVPRLHFRSLYQVCYPRPITLSPLAPVLFITIVCNTPLSQKSSSSNPAPHATWFQLLLQPPNSVLARNPRVSSIQPTTIDGSSKSCFGRRRGSQ